MSQAQAAAHAKASKDSRGNRSDDQFFEISRTGSNDVPEAALRAYRHAEKVMATADPDCDISWTLLAAIGRVETNHGRFGGAQLGSDGISRPEIRGPQLDGAGPFAAIRDSDNGVLDRDKVWDRAVGQMQFLPQTWRSVERDGDGDGTKNPDDIDDSALGSAVYLCGAGGSLADSRRHGPRGLPLQPLRLLRLAGAVDAGRLRDRRLRTALAAAPGQGEGRQGQDPEDEAHPAARRHQGQSKAVEDLDEGHGEEDHGPEADLHPEADAEAHAGPQAEAQAEAEADPAAGPEAREQVSGTWNKPAVVATASTRTPLDLILLGRRSTPQSLVGKTVTLKVERKAGRLVVHAVIASASAPPSAKASPSLAP